MYCAELSRVVYRHDIEEDPMPERPTRQEFFGARWVSTARFFQDVLTHTQAILVRHLETGLRVLVFRGTEQDIRDFLTDVDVGGLDFLLVNRRRFLYIVDLNALWIAFGQILRALCKRTMGRFG